MTVFSSQIWVALKATIGNVMTDASDNIEKNASFNKWCDTTSMDDAYEDDAEFGSPAFVSAVPEGTDLPEVAIVAGYVKRYIARKFGAKMSITAEAIADCKYKEILEVPRKLKKALYNTADVDATDILIHATDTNYPGGDGQPLASASHTLPSGGTWSNLLATAMTPSRAAVIIMTSMIRKLPGHSGAYGDLEPKRVLCPTEQWAQWKELMNSTRAPEAGEFNRVNVVNELGMQEPVPIKWWDNTTTNWGIQTTCDKGFLWKWRARPSSATWVENSQLLSYWSAWARWDCGYSDARCFVFSNA